MTAEEALMSSPEDTKINVEGGAKFDKDAGEVRVEVGQKLIGLTKEELEKYRNDPFWKPMRYVLFALFWLLWIAMFAGAILIVVLSPKCAEKQQPKWWQMKVSYQLLVPTFFDSDGDGVGDFAGVAEKLDNLRKVGVTTVYPGPVLTTFKDHSFVDVQAVADHSAFDARFVLGGSKGNAEEDFKKIIDAAHDKDMYVVVDVPLTSVHKSHSWLSKIDKEHEGAFYWKTAAAGANPAGFYPAPGRNAQKYLGYPDADHPVMNWDSPLVKETVMKTIKKLLNLGVDGLNLDHISRLAVDANGKPDHDRAIKRLSEIMGDIRAYTEGNEELKEKELVFFSSLHDMEDLHAKVSETNDLHYVVDTSFAKLNSTICNGQVAQCVHKTLDDVIDRTVGKGYIPHWQFSSPSSARLSSRFDGNTADLLTFMQLTLPGAVSLYYGQEIGLKDAVSVKAGVQPQHNVMQWKDKGEDHHGFTTKTGLTEADMFFPEQKSEISDDNFADQYAIENSPLKVFQKLAKLRQREEVLINGKTLKDAVQGDVLVFSRFIAATDEAGEDTAAAAGPAYVVALNFGEKESAVDFTKLGTGVLPEGKSLAFAEVVAFTSDMQNVRAREKLDLSTNTLQLPGKQGILIKL